MDPKPIISAPTLCQNEANLAKYMYFFNIHTNVCVIVRTSLSLSLLSVYLSRPQYKKTKQNKTKTKQNKTKQDKTKQNKTKRNKTKPTSHENWWVLQKRVFVWIQPSRIVLAKYHCCLQHIFHCHLDVASKTCVNNNNNCGKNEKHLFKFSHVRSSSQWCRKRWFVEHLLKRKTLCVFTKLTL